MPQTNPTDPQSQIRMTTQPCLVHGVHKPEPHVNHWHHVWPLGEGGPDIPDNKVVICPTGHMNVHDLLQHFKIMMGRVPYSVQKHYTVEERKLAKLGFDRLSRKEM